MILKVKGANAKGFIKKKVKNSNLSAHRAGRNRTFRLVKDSVSKSDWCKTTIYTGIA
jgi:hypothetical protein